MKTNTIQSIIKKHLLMAREITIGDDVILVGKSYDQVLQDVLAEAKSHPLIDESKVKTSKNCISWYASKMRSSKEKHYDADILKIKDRADWATLPEEKKEPAKKVAAKPRRAVSAKAQNVAAKA